MKRDQIEKYKSMRKEFDKLTDLIKNKSYNKFYLEFRNDNDYSYYPIEIDIDVDNDIVKIKYEKAQIFKYNGLVDILEWSCDLYDLIGK